MPAKTEADLQAQITFQTSSGDTKSRYQLIITITRFGKRTNNNKVINFGLQKTAEFDFKIYEKETHSNTTRV